MLLASFFDPNSNGFDITDVGAMIVVVLFATPVVMWISRRATRRLALLIRSIVQEELERFTKPIQKSANGGKSLPDANYKIDLIAEHLGITLPDSLKAND
ncbi:hypothetical protein UFOVP199_24 [uncultured Caudovirales phage]|uniref:Uncharacterized protein n=1 Tax=uncultured Caudovirales phage TaxID=2100421 RepID=A0A6J7WHY7_9CAUD|nr:hypothetical protein UFOVP199_24 [uncultured Caudovirales phage]